MAVTILEAVKNHLGITGNYLDVTITGYIEEVTAFLIDSGISETAVENDVGLISRGVADLWQYGGGDGRLSKYFYQRATQLRFGDSDG